MRDRSGSDLVCATLEELGVEHVFGMPGTQNVRLFESLRRSRLRTVVPTSELAASFMANGYFLGSGRPGVLTTIPGPGFTYALSGIAEARLDSVGLVHIVCQPAVEPGRAFQLQHIEQRALAAPIYKRVYQANDAGEVRPLLAEAHAHALAGEPGPVLVDVAAAAMSGRASPTPLPAPPAPVEPDAAAVEEIVRRLLEASRPLLYVGQGAVAAATELEDLAGLLRAPVATTTSGRGVLPEDHALCVPLDFGRPASAILNALVETSDLVLVLGCKMSHNGARGFRLRIPSEKLVRADASTEVLGANYPASLSLRCDVPRLLSALLRHRQRLVGRRASWPVAELEALRVRAREALASIGQEPTIACAGLATPAEFFALLRRHVPREGRLTTDCGMHEMLARRHFPVLASRGFLVPSDFQSMGFGLAAAIGARLACPARTVVALVGDGGLLLSGQEIATAVREAVPLTVIVFNDGHLGLVRAHQLGASGHAHGTRLQSPDWEMFARSLGAGFARLERDAESVLTGVLSAPGVNLIEVPIAGAALAAGETVRRLAAGAARAVVPQRIWNRLRPGP